VFLQELRQHIVEVPDHELGATDLWQLVLGKGAGRHTAEPGLREALEGVEAVRLPRPPFLDDHAKALASCHPELECQRTGGGLRQGIAEGFDPALALAGSGEVVAGKLVALAPGLLVSGVDDVAATADLELDHPVEHPVALPADVSS